MTMQAATRVGARMEPVPKVISSAELDERVKARDSRISEVAFDLFILRDLGEGQALDDWLQAEASLYEPVRVEILQDESYVTVLAEVPGFGADELDVCITPRKMLIGGRRRAGLDDAHSHIILTERNWREIFRFVELPHEVDPSATRLDLVNGILTAKLPKVAPPGGPADPSAP